MKINEKPLFHSYAHDLEVGDLVTWRSFDQNEKYETIIVDFKGAIIQIFKMKHYETGRFVYYATVLPYGETQTMQVPVHILKKQTI